jgi:predicted RNA-binding Zn-ribbon protein involved in translation (DUF1610 family)
MGSYRQKAVHHQQQRTQRRGGGGGGAPTFIDQFKPDLDTPDIIRIIAGDYEVKTVAGDGTIEIDRTPYFPFGEHYHATLERSCVCSAGPNYGAKDKRDPCYACDMFWQGMTTGTDGKKKRGPMSRRDMVSFTVVHFYPYHKVEQVDRQTGQVRINDRTKEPYFSWWRCEGGKNCQFCMAQKEKRLAQRLHWDLGTNHFSTLWEYEKEIGKGCVTCGGRSTIEWDAYVCRECGEAKVVREETGLKLKEIDEIFTKPNKCSACGFEGFLSELISCSNCTPMGHEPVRATLFDVDLHVRRNQTDAKSNATTLMVTQWSDPRPVDKNFTDLAKPMDLSKIFAPTPLDKQAAIFNLTPAQLAALKAGSLPSGRQPATGDAAGDTSRPYR